MSALRSAGFTGRQADTGAPTLVGGELRRPLRVATCEQPDEFRNPDTGASVAGVLVPESWRDRLRLASGDVHPRDLVIQQFGSHTVNRRSVMIQRCPEPGRLQLSMEFTLRAFKGYVVPVMKVILTQEVRRVLLGSWHGRLVSAALTVSFAMLLYDVVQHISPWTLEFDVIGGGFYWWGWLSWIVLEGPIMVVYRLLMWSLSSALTLCLYGGMFFLVLVIGAIVMFNEWCSAGRNIATQGRELGWAFFGVLAPLVMFCSLGMLVPIIAALAPVAVPILTVVGIAQGVARSWEATQRR